MDRSRPGSEIESGWRRREGEGRGAMLVPRTRPVSARAGSRRVLLAGA
jgi:hypothetical protein